MLTPLRPRLSKLVNLLDRLPSRCAVCGSWPTQPVCQACTTRFGAAVPRCQGCALPLPAQHTASGLCGQCLSRQQPARLRSCVTAVDYAYPWDSLIARLKFRNEPGWAGPLAGLWLHNPAAVGLWQDADVVIPVPLTAQRLAQRGYNQAWELAKALRRRIPASPHGSSPDCLPEGLLRLGEVPPQHSLGREQRLRNLQGLFMAHPLHVPQLRGAQVLLVDDVSTTGATLDSAAQALLQAGAESVSGLVLARTP